MRRDAAVIFKRRELKLSMKKEDSEEEREADEKEEESEEKREQLRAEILEIYI